MDVPDSWPISLRYGIWGIHIYVTFNVNKLEKKSEEREAIRQFKFMIEWMIKLKCYQQMH